MTVFKLPVVLLTSATAPIAVLDEPVVSRNEALSPLAVLVERREHRAPRCSPGRACARGALPVTLNNIRAPRHSETATGQEPASLVGFFSAVLVWEGDEPFEDSLGVADFSPPDDVAGDSFLAASL
jgi:hypothetical protein